MTNLPALTALRAEISDAIDRFALIAIAEDVRDADYVSIDRTKEIVNEALDDMLKLSFLEAEREADRRHRFAVECWEKEKAARDPLVGRE